MLVNIFIVRDWWKKFAFPERAKLVVEGDIEYKKWRSTPNPGLEFEMFKATICEQQACNLVNVNVSIYLLIVECKLSFFHNVLEYVACFSDILVRFDLPTSGDSYTTSLVCKPSH